MTLKRGDACGLEEREDALGHGAHDPRLAFLHLREVERRGGHLDAVDREFRLQTVVQLARLEQRLGRDAARVQAGAAEGRRPVLVLPLINTGDGEVVLCRADGRRVARRTPADHDDVEGVSRSLLFAH